MKFLRAPRSRVPRILGATTLVIGLGVGAVAAQTSGAGAIGTTHTLVTSSKQNLSQAIEKPSFSFSCNDATGAYKFKIGNVQVIAVDRDSFWPGGKNFRLDVTSPIGSVSTAGLTIPLVQNTTNGLYGATGSGVLPTLGEPVSNICATGSTVKFWHSLFGSLETDLNLVAQLS
jgi:hypothetical protein